VRAALFYFVDLCRGAQCAPAGG